MDRERGRDYRLDWDKEAKWCETEGGETEGKSEEKGGGEEAQSKIQAQQSSSGSISRTWLVWSDDM